jgi:hypothetical protein
MINVDFFVDLRFVTKSHDAVFFLPPTAGSMPANQQTTSQQTTNETQVTQRLVDSRDGEETPTGLETHLR